MIEAVYVAEVDSLCQDATRPAQEEEPWPALVAWVRHFVTCMATKRVLLDALDRESGVFCACRDALYEYCGPLLTRAQDSREARADFTMITAASSARSIPDRLRRHTSLGTGGVLTDVTRTAPNTQDDDLTFVLGVDGRAVARTHQHSGDAMTLACNNPGPGTDDDNDSEAVRKPTGLRVP